MNPPHTDLMAAPTGAEAPARPGTAGVRPLDSHDPVTSVHPEPLSLDVSPPQQDGTVFVFARGIWDRSSASRGKALFRRVFSRRPRLVIVDTSHVAIADAAGLDALLATLRTALQRGIEIDFQNMPSQVGLLAGSAQLWSPAEEAGTGDAELHASEIGA